MTTATIQNTEGMDPEQQITRNFDFEASLHLALEAVGEKFGLYDIMVQSGPISPPCLATQAGIPQQAAKVWLDAQVSGNYLKHCPATGRYCLWCTWPRRTG